MSRRESSPHSRSRDSSPSYASRSTHESRKGRHLDHKMDKVLDMLDDLRSSFRQEFTSVHRNIQELQQFHQDHDSSLSALSRRVEQLEQSRVSGEPPAKRRSGWEPAATVPARDPQPAGPSSSSNLPLRPRVTLSGFKQKRSVDEFKEVVQELFGRLEGIKLSCKMLFADSVRMEFDNMEEAKRFRERVLREKPSHEGAQIYCNFVLPWKESRAGFLGREARRQALVLLGEPPNGALRLCSRSHTLFLRREVLLHVDATSLQLVRGPAWPEEHEWPDFVAKIEGRSRG